MDPRVMAAYGSDNSQLRRFFTAKPAGVDGKGMQVAADGCYEKKTEFTRWISGLMNQGRLNCYRTYRHWAAVDLMWDGPLLPENVPLTAYAHGKISIESCAKELNQIGCAHKFIDQVPQPCKEGEKPSVKPVVNLPRLHEVCVGVGRSFINRRVNAQANKYNSLRPFFKFESRSTTMEGHLRGEVMSQYAEVMSDGYGYRHQHTQCLRDMLSAGRCVQFPAGAWESDTETVIVPDGDTVSQDTETKQIKGKDVRFKTIITREGVKFINVHNARVIYDTSQPLASINTDTGITHIGYYDVKRFREIRTNPAFFNTDRITWNTSGVSVIDQNRTYFDLIFQGQPVNFPTPPQTKVEGGAFGVDLAAANERTANSFIYSQTEDENAVFVTDLRVKVKPSDWGMGDYKHNVWLRVLVASDDTVIYAEWLPSLPAVYWGHNENDNRLLNAGNAHEIMPWQDQLSNIFSQLLIKMKNSLLRVIMVNVDVLPKDVREKFKAAMDSPQYYISPQLLEVSFKDLADNLNLDIDKVFKISTPNSADDSEFINNSFKAIIQILAILERLLNLSPQEQGQPAPREITAEEVSAIESTTQVTYNAISTSVDEARGAWKKIIYDSSMAFGSDQIYLPGSQRFSKETIVKAGFKVIDDADADKGAAKNGRTIIGSKQCLVHNYVFTSRDGGDRSTNREAANVLVQLLGQVLPLIGPEAMGKKRIFEIVNEVFRLIASYDLKLEVNEGEDNQVMAPKAQEVMQQLQQELQAQEKEIGGLTDAIEKMGQIIQQMQAQTQAAAPVAPAA